MSDYRVPKELISKGSTALALHFRSLPRHKIPTLGGQVEAILAAVLPTHEAMVRAKVAEELRADAAAHRRLVTRKPSAYDEARLARAKTLDDAAARVTRGGQCDEHWWEVRSLTGPPAPYGPCTKCGTPHPEASL